MHSKIRALLAHLVLDMPVDDQMLLPPPSYLKHCFSGQLHFQVSPPSCQQHSHYPSSQTSQRSSWTKDHWHCLPTLYKDRSKEKNAEEMSNDHVLLSWSLWSLPDSLWVCIQHLFNFRAAANSYIPSYTALKCSKHLEQLISFPPMWHQYILIRMLHLREIKLFVPTVLGSTLTHDNYFIPTP